MVSVLLTPIQVLRSNNATAVWTTGGREDYNSRDGSVEGARAFAKSEGANYDWCVILNSRQYIREQDWEDLIYTIIPGVWGSHIFAGQ